MRIYTRSITGNTAKKARVRHITPVFNQTWLAVSPARVITFGRYGPLTFGFAQTAPMSSMARGPVDDETVSKRVRTTDDVREDRRAARESADKKDDKTNVLTDISMLGWSMKTISDSSPSNSMETVFSPNSSSETRQLTVRKSVTLAVECTSTSHPPTHPHRLIPSPSHPTTANVSELLTSVFRSRRPFL